MSETRKQHSIFARPTLCVEPSLPIRIAIGFMSAGASLLPVVSSNEKFLGTVSSKNIIDFLGAGRLYRKIVCEKFGGRLAEALFENIGAIMNRDLAYVKIGVPLGKLIKVMLKRKVSELAIIDEQGCLKGIVTSHDIIDLMSMESKPYRIKVSVLMSRKVVSVPEGAALLKAMKLMMTYDLRGLLVTDEFLSPVGVLYNKDILQFFNMNTIQALFKLGQVSYFHSTNLSSVMTKEITWISKSKDAVEAVQLMAAHGTDMLFVMEKRRCIGIITATGIITKCAPRLVV